MLEQLRIALDEATPLMDGEAVDAAAILYDAVREALGLPESHLEDEQTRAMADVLTSGEPLAPEQFGKFFASPYGEPNADERCRAFDTEEAARDYALALRPTLEAPYYMEWLKTTPGDAFVFVGRFAEDSAEARDEMVEGWPTWVPYGWADSRGYFEGTFEESAYLWPGPHDA